MKVSKGEVQRAAKLARLLGNPVRLRILLALREGPKCVTELMRETGRTQANVSQHLMVLRAAGIVAFEREGMRSVYRLRSQRMEALLDKLLAFADESHELDRIEGMERRPCVPKRCKW